MPRVIQTRHNRRTVDFQRREFAQIINVAARTVERQVALGRADRHVNHLERVLAEARVAATQVARVGAGDAALGLDAPETALAQRLVVAHELAVPLFRVRAVESVDVQPLALLLDRVRPWLLWLRFLFRFSARHFRLGRARFRLGLGFRGGVFGFLAATKILPLFCGHRGGHRGGSLVALLLSFALRLFSVGARATVQLGRLFAILLFATALAAPGLEFAPGLFGAHLGFVFRVLVNLLVFVDLVAVAAAAAAVAKICIVVCPRREIRHGACGTDLAAPLPNAARRVGEPGHAGAAHVDKLGTEAVELAHHLCLVEFAGRTRAVDRGDELVLHRALGAPLQIRIARVTLAARQRTRIDGDKRRPVAVGRERAPPVDDRESRVARQPRVPLR